MSSLVLILCLLTVFQSPCQAQEFQQISETLLRDKQLKALTQHPELVGEVLDAMDSLKDLWTVYLPGLLKSMSNSTISDACYNSTMAIFGSNLQPNITIPEIIPLLDATGKQGAGLLDGNLIIDAAFDECFEYNYTGYCMGKIHPSFIPPTIPFRWTVGLCVPKHCSPSDVGAVMNFAPDFEVDENTMKCTDSKRPALGPGAIVMIVVCLLFGMLVAAGTILDKATARRKKPDSKVKWQDFITAFSLCKTVPTLLATKQASSVITSLNGLRVISMFWVILGHTFVWIILYGVDNKHSILNLIRRFSFQPVLHTTFAVDSFFFLSGVLVAYLTLRQMKKRNGRFPFVHYYVHRYLRLTPIYAFVLFFAWFLTRHIAAGPSFPLVDPFAPQCSKFWWTNLLYINNVHPWEFNDQCLVWTWYLANDMQFFVISPLMLIPAYFLLPVGVVISSAFLLCSFIITATLTGVLDLPASYINTNPDATVQYLNLIYEKPWARIPPYIVGLALGYVLYKNIRLPFSGKVNTLLHCVMWIAVGVLLASPLYGLYFQAQEHDATTAENVIFATFSRFSWGVGMALLVFSCHNGYGRLINSFLSMKIWTPLARMTLNAYLVHPVVMTVICGQLQKSVHVTDFTIATFTVAFVVLSYAVAGVLCLVVEFPLASVEMLLFKLLGLESRQSQRLGLVIANKGVGKELEEVAVKDEAGKEEEEEGEENVAVNTEADKELGEEEKSMPINKEAGITVYICKEAGIELEEEGERNMTVNDEAGKELKEEGGDKNNMSVRKEAGKEIEADDEEATVSKDAGKELKEKSMAVNNEAGKELDVGEAEEKKEAGKEEGEKNKNKGNTEGETNMHENA